MKKLIKFLASKIKYIIFIYVLIQIVLILTINTNYRSDALYYYKLAQECIEQNEFYPARQHLYEDYIVAPLYINTLVLVLKVYNSTITISLFNLVVIILQIMFLYKITKQIFYEDIAQLTVLLFILYLKHYWLNASELYRTFLSPVDFGFNLLLSTK